MPTISACLADCYVLSLFVFSYEAAHWLLFEKNAKNENMAGCCSAAEDVHNNLPEYRGT